LAAVITGGLPTLSMLLINGAIIPPGRTPNADSANNGYRMFEATSGNNSITDNQLGATINFTGAELVARSQDFITVRTRITGHSGNTLTFSTVSGQAFKPNMGYFVQSHISTLDQTGEWFYDTSGGTKKIKMYYPATPPTIQAATLTNLVNMVYTNGTIKSNVTFANISFVGSEGNMIQATYCNNLTFKNCQFSFAGIDAIDTRYTPNLLLNRCRFESINNTAWWSFNSGLTTGEAFTFDTVRRVGYHPGLLAVTGSIYGETSPGTGISSSNSNRTITDSYFDSIGYSGINVGHGENVLISRNIVKYFCKVKNDGAGIYSPAFQLGTDPRAYNFIISDNVVSNSFDASAGTDHSNNPHVRGIYLDAATTGRTVRGNVIYLVWEGIYISSAQHVRISDNTLFGCGYYSASPLNYSGAFSISNSNPVPPYQYVRNDTVTNNIFFAKYTDQLLFYDYDLFDSCRNIGYQDSNYYINPGGNSKLFTHNPTWPNIYYDFAAWKARHPTYEQNSFVSPKITPVITAANYDTYLKFIVNETGATMPVNLGDSVYSDAKGAIYTGLMNLGANKSLALFRDGYVPKPPDFGIRNYFIKRRK